REGSADGRSEGARRARGTAKQPGEATDRDEQTPAAGGGGGAALRHFPVPDVRVDRRGRDTDRVDRQVAPYPHRRAALVGSGADGRGRGGKRRRGEGGRKDGSA